MCRHVAWWTISRQVTDYVQRLRRKFPRHRIEYLRVIERHRDYYPHVHMLLCFDPVLRIYNKRYFSPEFYYLCQRLWKIGFSKPEKIRVQSNALNYILKYFKKQLVAKPRSPFAVFSSQRNTVYRLKGKVVVMFGVSIRVLSWSRGMQTIYAKSQSYKLVKSPNIPHVAPLFLSL